MLFQKHVDSTAAFFQRMFSLESGANESPVYVDIRETRERLYVLHRLCALTPPEVSILHSAHSWQSQHKTSWKRASEIHDFLRNPIPYPLCEGPNIVNLIIQCSSPPLHIYCILPRWNLHLLKSCYTFFFLLQGHYFFHSRLPLSLQQNILHKCMHEATSV